MEVDVPDLAITDVPIITVTAELTAQLFLHAVSKNALFMSTFYLLVLDGAHNAHHSHPYAHLMLDYYHPCPPTKRPRFTGLMAASASITPDILFAENACNASIYGLSAEMRSI